MTSLDVYQGDELSFEVEVVEESPTAPPINLTGGEVRVALFRTNGPAALVLGLGSGVELVNPTSPAVFIVRLTPAQTATLTGKYLIEAKVKLTTGRVETVMRGRLKTAHSALKDMP